jgi:hypothetical protein
VTEGTVLALGQRDHGGIDVVSHAPIVGHGSDTIPLCARGLGFRDNMHTTGEHSPICVHAVSD